MAFAQRNFAQEETREQAQQHDDEAQKEDVGDSNCQADLDRLDELVEEYHPLWAESREAMLKLFTRAWIQQRLWIELGLTIRGNESCQGSRGVALQHILNGLIVAYYYDNINLFDGVV